MRAPNPFLSSWGVFSQPLFRSSISHAVPIAPRLSLDSVAAALDRGDFESGSNSKSGRLTSDALFPLHRSLRRRGGGLRARRSLDSAAAALDRGDFESGSDSKSGRLTSDALFPLHRSLRRRGGGLRAGFFGGCSFSFMGCSVIFLALHFFTAFCCTGRAGCNTNRVCRADKAGGIRDSISGPPVVLILPRTRAKINRRCVERDLRLQCGRISATL